MTRAVPKRLKEVRGNPGKRPILPSPEYPALRLRVPRGLPPLARAKWRVLAPLLGTTGIATEADRDGLADYCLCLARLAEAEADIAKRGLLVKGDRGMVKNPSAQLATSYRHACQKWAARFGLTPVDRGKVDATAQPAEDEFSTYLAQVKEVANAADGGPDDDGDQ